MICKLACLLLCLYASSIPSVESSNEFLETLTDEQIKFLFHTDRQHVPTFSVVSITSQTGRRHRREIRPVQFEAEGHMYRFELVPSRRSVIDSNMPVWTVESAPFSTPNYTYHRINTKESRIDQNYYEDPNKMAVFLPYYNDKGYILYDGIFMKGSKEFILRAIPESWWREELLSDIDYNKHIIYGKDIKTAQKIDDTMVDFHDIVPETIDIMKLDEPLTTLYPKILVALDYHYFKSLGYSIAEIVKHMALYWHVVDLMYKQIPEPAVNIKLKGIIIAKDERAMNYVYQSRNYTMSPEFVNAFKVVGNANSYFDEIFKSDTGFTDYNIPFIFTGLDTGSIGGIATTGHICTRGYRSAVIQESRGHGIAVTTHELGHTMGLAHDRGEDSINECFAYPNESSTSTSTIMAPFLITADHYIWSKCSLRDIKKFATLKLAECLKYPSVHGYE